MRNTIGVGDGYRVLLQSRSTAPGLCQFPRDVVALKNQIVRFRPPSPNVKVAVDIWVSGSPQERRSATNADVLGESLFSIPLVAIFMCVSVTRNCVNICLFI